MNQPQPIQKYMLDNSPKNIINNPHTNRFNQNGYNNNHQQAPIDYCFKDIDLEYYNYHNNNQ